MLSISAIWYWLSSTKLPATLASALERISAVPNPSYRSVAVHNRRRGSRPPAASMCISVPHHHPVFLDGASKCSSVRSEGSHRHRLWRNVSHRKERTIFPGHHVFFQWQQITPCWKGLWMLRIQFIIFTLGRKGRPSPYLFQYTLILHQAADSGAPALALTWPIVVLQSFPKDVLFQRLVKQLSVALRKS